jgi:hypothetical protein
MARRRMIDPGLWASGHNTKLIYRQRLLFIGLISNADDEGRIKGNPNYIRAVVFPYDDIPGNEILDDLNLLESEKMISQYMVEDVRYIQLSKWKDFQTINRPQLSKIPSAIDDKVNSSMNESVNESRTNSRLREVKGIKKENTQKKKNEVVYNFENHNKEVPFVIAFWKQWVNPNSQEAIAGSPTPTEKKQIMDYAFAYSQDIEFWKPYLGTRLIRIQNGDFHHSSIKAFAGGGFRDYDPEKPKKGKEPIDRKYDKTVTGYYKAYCSKCGKMELPPGKFQLYEGSTCCKVDYTPVKPKESPGKPHKVFTPDTRSESTQSLADILP